MISSSQISTNSEPHCFICSGSVTPFGDRLGYSYLQCTQCQTIQLSPLPLKSDLAELYSRDYADSGHHDNGPEQSEQFKSALWNEIVLTVRRHLTGGRILDLGTGWGGLCKYLNDAGYSCEGVDQSVSMVEYCKRQGLPVRLGDLSSVEPKSVDAIVMCCVSEHLVEHDTWLAQAHSVLRDGGLLITLHPTGHFASLAGKLLQRRGFLPDLNGAFSPPWHTALITCQGMEQLAHRNNFVLVETRMAPNTRRGGLVGLALILVEWANRIAWPLLGKHWPLVICHIFVMRKGLSSAELSSGSQVGAA